VEDEFEFEVCPLVRCERLRVERAAPHWLNWPLGEFS